MAEAGDWLKKLWMWDWHTLQLNGYPGWERVLASESKAPAFVRLTHTRGPGGVESHALCVAWDDIATVGFYQRDWTDDGLPFVNQGETYHSGWWFQTIGERDRFLHWVKTQPGWLIWTKCMTEIAWIELPVGG